MNYKTSTSYSFEKPGTSIPVKSVFAGSPTMTRLLDALNKGVNIGDYGRLAFALVARHFMREDEIVSLLGRQPGVGNVEACALLNEITAHDYSPPTQAQLVEWQSYQSWRICADEESEACDFYAELEFPQYIFDRMQSELEPEPEKL